MVYQDPSQALNPSIRVGKQVAEVFTVRGVARSEATERAADVDDCMSRMLEGDHRYRYSVAWIDCLASGAALGRSVLTRGNHARVDELSPRDRQTASVFAPSMLVRAMVTKLELGRTTPLGSPVVPEV